ncbi:MAG TPA: hypothetical protein VGA01_17180 [Candidatus Binatia bacterium]
MTILSGVVDVANGALLALSAACRMAALYIARIFAGSMAVRVKSYRF